MHGFNIIYITTGIFISTSIFVIPYIIYMLAGPYVKNLLWVPNVLGYVYFMKADNMVEVFILLTNLILSIGLSFILIRKTYLHIKQLC